MPAPHKEEVLLHTLLAPFCSIRGTSSLLLVLGEGYPISAPDWSPKLQATVSGGQGHKASGCIAHRSLAGFQNGEGSPPAAPECPCQHTPPAVGFVQQRGESGEVAGTGRGKAMSFLVTQTFQGLQEGVSPLVGWVPQARRGGGPEAEGKAGEFPATEAKGRPPTPSLIHFI